MSQYLYQCGKETLVVSTTAVQLVQIPVGAHWATIYIGSNPIRWEADGTNPIAAGNPGMYLGGGGYIDWSPWTTRFEVDYGRMLQLLRFIRDTAASGDATLEVQYFGLAEAQ